LFELEGCFRHSDCGEGVKIVIAAVEKNWCSGLAPEKKHPANVVDVKENSCNLKDRPL